MTGIHDTLARARLVPMRPRDAHEPHRAASTLELFFDLVFVVAVSVTAIQLHHELTEGLVGPALVSYALVFFAIWWAWMNFTWFATSFDTDDWLYRLLTILQMSGVLVLAAGAVPAFHGEFGVVVVGYIIMRVAMVAQWMRASRGAAALRRTAIVYAAGIAVVQLLWLSWLFVPEGVRVPMAIALVAAELAVPIVAERPVTTPWNPHHITERYGLFTLILLGESLLASANAIFAALEQVEHLAPLIVVAVLTLLITAGLWWIYFWPPHHRAISSFASSLRYGYVHYVVFAAAGAFSAGVEVQIDLLEHHTELSALAAGFTVSIPVALFVAGIWWIALRAHASPIQNAIVPLGAVVALLAPFTGFTMPVVTAALVVIVVSLVLAPPDSVDAEARSAD